MITYKLINNINGDLTNIQATNENGLVIIIPLDNANTDYQKYLEWVAEGNTPEEAE